MMNGSDVAATVAGLDHGPGIGAVVVVADPALGAFFVIWSNGCQLRRLSTEAVAAASATH